MAVTERAGTLRLLTKVVLGNVLFEASAVVTVDDSGVGSVAAAFGSCVDSSPDREAAGMQACNAVVLGPRVIVMVGNCTMSGKNLGGNYVGRSMRMSGVLE